MPVGLRSFFENLNLYALPRSGIKMNAYVLVRLSMITGILSVMIGLISCNMPNVIIGLTLILMASTFHMKLIEQNPI